MKLRVIIPVVIAAVAAVMLFVVWRANEGIEFSSALEESVMPPSGETTLRMFSPDDKALVPLDLPVPSGTIQLEDQLVLEPPAVEIENSISIPNASTDDSSWSIARGPASIETGDVGQAPGSPQPPTLTTLSTSQLAAKFATSGSAEQSEIIDLIKLRDQRVTRVSGEFFPDMAYEEEHNAFITVSRGRLGDSEAPASENTQLFTAGTMEPTAFEVKNTKTTNLIGAQLVGANFEFTPSEIQWRYVLDGGEDTFNWVVKPKKEGNLQLTVVLKNKLRIGDTELVLPVSQFPKNVTVSVDIWTKLGRLTTGAETAIDKAQKIGLGLAALFGFGSIGGAWAAIGAWRKRRAGPASP
ncbi:hypothetical protein [Roseibium algae]|uniref:DUF3068 domain-containing protein n=1 Tax=Roseibium algae TaxID=3123038 RepID=A0ABU8TKM9_9HYPH